MKDGEEKPGDLKRAWGAVAVWREQSPAGTANELIAALGSEFDSDYGLVLRGTLFVFECDDVGILTRSGHDHVGRVHRLGHCAVRRADRAGGLVRRAARLMP